MNLRLVNLCGNPYRWDFVHPTKFKKTEDATWFVHCVYIGGAGTLVYFEIENKEDMKFFEI